MDRAPDFHCSSASASLRHRRVVSQVRGSAAPPPTLARGYATRTRLFARPGCRLAADPGKAASGTAETPPDRALACHRPGAAYEGSSSRLVWSRRARPDGTFPQLDARPPAAADGTSAPGPTRGSSPLKCKILFFNSTCASPAVSGGALVGPVPARSRLFALRPAVLTRPVPW